MNPLIAIVLFILAWLGLGLLVGGLCFERHRGDEEMGVVDTQGRTEARNLCADCSAPIGQDKGPVDGWQLEDGRTVCNACCVADTRRFAGTLRRLSC